MIFFTINSTCPYSSTLLMLRIISTGVHTNSLAAAVGTIWIGSDEVGLAMEPI